MYRVKLSDFCKDREPVLGGGDGGMGLRRVWGGLVFTRPSKERKNLSLLDLFCVLLVGGTGCNITTELGSRTQCDGQFPAPTFQSLKSP